jgi:hypothetical protein
MNNVLIVKKKEIAFNYLLGWFLLDFLSSIPLDWISDKNLSVLFRLSKIPRLLKVFRMFKFMRLMKLVKSHNLLGSFFTHPHMERLFLSLLIYFIVFHVVACLWMMAGTYDDDFESWVSRLGYKDKSIIELYIICWYWTLQTVLTVGKPLFYGGS